MEESADRSRATLTGFLSGGPSPFDEANRSVKSLEDFDRAASPAVRAVWNSWSV
jgi:hypothetical protein